MKRTAHQTESSSCALQEHATRLRARDPKAALHPALLELAGFLQLPGGYVEGTYPPMAQGSPQKAHLPELQMGGTGEQVTGRRVG